MPSCSGPMPASTTTKPTTSEIGKPTANRLSDGRGAAHDAEREVDDEQRGDAGQRDGDGAGEQLPAPQHQRPETFGPRPVVPIGSVRKPSDQHLEQREVAAERQEHRASRE